MSQAYRIQKRKPTREPFALFLGDLHTGSTAALSPQGQPWTPVQAGLFQAWRMVKRRALALARVMEFHLMLGGDMVDGPRHHNTWETWGTNREQREGSVEIVKPLSDHADEVRALIGTEAHAGPKGDDDQTVAQMLGAKTAQFTWELSLGGKSLFWTHHGVRVTREPNNDTNGLHNMCKRLYQHSLRGDIQMPDFAIFHDAHFSPSPVSAYGVTVAVCGCWQLNTLYGYKLAPENSPAIGVLAWFPRQNRIQRWLYRIDHDQAQEVIIG